MRSDTSSYSIIRRNTSSLLWFRVAVYWSCCYCYCCYYHLSCRAFTPTPTRPTTLQRRQTVHLVAAAAAKRNRRLREEDDEDRWYESVDENASPDAVFWEEMERQQRLQQSADLAATVVSNPMDDLSAATASRQRTTSASAAAASVATTAASSSSSSSSTISLNNPNPATPSNQWTAEPLIEGAAPMTAKQIESTLAEYAVHMVDDNWLDEELAAAMHENDQYFMEDDSVPSLEEQLEEWEQAQDSDDHDDNDGNNAWMQSDEPWDHWGEPPPSSTDDDDQVEHIPVDPKNRAAEFLFSQDNDGDDDTEQDKEARAARLQQEQEEEEAYAQRLAAMPIISRRLERARDNPKAAAFFSREPDSVEGFDRLWVSAIDNVCMKNLVGTFRNYGVQFADNFGDFEDDQTLLDYSIEDIASCKARRVFEVTGLPCIASRTSFEVEPVADFKTPPGAAGRSAASSPRVLSGYRFNDVGLHVDYVSEALRPVSEPSRVTRFKTCLCYYDGQMEVFDYGICDVDLVFCNSLRTFIPVSVAINEMMQTLQLTFGLEYQKWYKQDIVRGGGSGRARVKLRDRVLKEGRVLPNDIVDVSAFMDSMVDVNLMDDCAQELAQRFLDQKPNKILTVATTGLVVALPLAKYLQVPVVYARKERSLVMADTFQAAYSSKTVGKNRELLVAKSHLHPEDRVLIIDDFLSSGAAQEALLRIVSDAEATAVGVGVLLEKVYDAGRQSLSGFDVPIESLCRIASVQGGVIQLIEEEGYDGM